MEAFQSGRACRVLSKVTTSSATVDTGGAVREATPSPFVLPCRARFRRRPTLGGVQDCKIIYQSLVEKDKSLTHVDCRDAAHISYSTILLFIDCTLTSGAKSVTQAHVPGWRRGGLWAWGCLRARIPCPRRGGPPRAAWEPSVCGKLPLPSRNRYRGNLGELELVIYY